MKVVSQLNDVMLNIGYVYQYLQNVRAEDTLFFIVDICNCG